MGKINKKTTSASKPQASSPEKTRNVDISLTEHKPSQVTRAKIQKDLVENIKKACIVLASNGFNDLASEITTLTSKAVRDKFSVSFVGEFSHGKSTLINKLLEMDSLPVDTLPTTSLLTKITCGNTDNLEVLNKSGKVIQKLPLEAKSWEGLVAFDEEGNPIEIEGRSVVKVTINNKWLNKARIDILDTPGANDGSKARDLEISRALMVTDGAVVCVDAQKGIMQTQMAFIKDRLLGPKVPYVAFAITHLDLVKKENRDRVVASILGKLKSMKVGLPIIVTNDVEMPSNKFTGIVGIDKLRKLLLAWSKNPDRIHRIETWLAAGVQGILDNAMLALEHKKEILATQGEERKKIIVKKQNQIAALHSEWEKVRDDINERRDICKEDFSHRLNQEIMKIIQRILYRINTVPDPAKWYKMSYTYEISTLISASIITLDNIVTENARNDFEKINHDLMTKYKAILEREGKAWGRTSDSSSYVHSSAPELSDVGAIQEKSTKLTALATAAGGLLATMMFGIGGIVGTIGASTAARLLTKNKIDIEVNKARMELGNFVERDVRQVMNDAVKDCEGRINLIYADMSRAAQLTESNWMKTQMEVIASAAKPSEESAAKAEETINSKIKEIKNVSETFNKYLL